MKCRKCGSLIIMRIHNTDFGPNTKYGGPNAKSVSQTLRMTHPDPAVALIQVHQRPHVDVELSTASGSKILRRVDTVEQMMESADIAASIR